MMLDNFSHANIFIFLFIAIPMANGTFWAGVKSELQLQGYTTATATPDPSCIFDLCCNLQQCWILNPLSEARDQTHILTNPMSSS